MKYEPNIYETTSTSLDTKDMGSAKLEVKQFLSNVLCNLSHSFFGHCRNLFFRTAACLEIGVLPVMVLEGEAPSIKWNTIDARNNVRNPGHPGVDGGGAPSSNGTTTKTKRSHFNAVLRKVC